MSSLSNKVIKKCDNCSNFLVTLKRGKKNPTSGDVRYTSHFQLSHPHSLRHLFFTMQPPYLVACPPFIPRTSPAPPPFPLLHFYYHISPFPPPSWCSHNLTHSIFPPPVSLSAALPTSYNLLYANAVFCRLDLLSLL